MMVRWLWAAVLSAVGLIGAATAVQGQSAAPPAVNAWPTLPPAAPEFVPVAGPALPPPVVAPARDVAPPTGLPATVVPGPAVPVLPTIGSEPIARTAPAAAPLMPLPAPAQPETVTVLPRTVVSAPATLPAPAPAGTSSDKGKAPSGSSDPPADKKDESSKERKADADKDKPDKEQKDLADSLHQDDSYGFKSLFDSLHPEGRKGKAWYEKLSFRGYTQFRWGRSLVQDEDSAEPSLFNDRAINGTAENFYIRRARLTLSGDVSEHLFLYLQTDYAVTPPGTSTVSYFAQLRDLYGDVYFDKEKVHRLRVGISKVPFGWENLQSSQNRYPLERTNPINSAAPNERDLGVFYYWTPEEQQKLFKDLVDGGLKGSGNYGVFGIGVYNGQALPQLEQNHNLHAVARCTWPFRLPDGQVVEAGLQGYTGKYVVAGTEILPLGVGPEIVPAGTAEDDHRGIVDQRLAASFVWYPQPFGFQAEWCVGRGPGLNDAQTEVVRRSLHGGYVMAMYKFDTGCHGIVTPYARCQYYRGGYKSVANAPYGTHRELDLGVEWIIRREMELTVEYSLVDGVAMNPPDADGVAPYRHFDGGVLRVQFQINY